MQTIGETIYDRLKQQGLSHQDIYTQVARAANQTPFWALKRKRECQEAARVKPLAGPAMDAFSDKEINIDGKLICRVVPTRMKVLQEIGSPIIEMFQTAIKTGAVSFDFKPEAQWELCFVFTESPKRLRELLAGEKGVEALKEAAAAAIGDNWDAALIDGAMCAIMEQFQRHAATVSKVETETQEKGEISFFRELLAKRDEQLKALAGS
jgi:hypothetical protein